MISSFPAKPLASNKTVSFVDVSRSTEIILKVSGITDFKALFNNSLEIFKSVVMNPNIVAIFGWIIPDPLQQAPMVTVFPPTSISTARCFGLVSVVIIEVATSIPAWWSSFNCFKASPIPFSIGSVGSCFPITPVEQIRTFSLSTSKASPTILANFSFAWFPSSPVQALAIPLLIAIALTVS